MPTSEDGFPLVNKFPSRSTNIMSSSFKPDNDFNVGVIATTSPVLPFILLLIFPDFPETNPLS